MAKKLTVPCHFVTLLLCFASDTLQLLFCKLNFVCLLKLSCLQLAHKRTHKPAEAAQGSRALHFLPFCGDAFSEKASRSQKHVLKIKNEARVLMEGRRARPNHSVKRWLQAENHENELKWRKSSRCFCSCLDAGLQSRCRFCWPLQN